MLRVLRALFVSIASMAAVAVVTTPGHAASDPRPYFFTQLNLTNCEHTVVAGGPMNWNADDAWATIQDVTITQGAVTGTSIGYTKVVNGRDVDWWLNASSWKRFHPGPAEASALEIGHRTDGTVYTYSWENQVRLTGRC